MTMCQFSFCIPPHSHGVMIPKTFLKLCPLSYTRWNFFLAGLHSRPTWFGVRFRADGPDGGGPRVGRVEGRRTSTWKKKNPSPRRRDHLYLEPGGPDCAPQRWWPPICRRRSSKMASVMSVKPLRRRSRTPAVCPISLTEHAIADLVRCPLTPEQARDLLEIIDDRHGRGSTIVTSQLPVDHWHEVIGNPTIADAILDRLVHNAHRLTLKGDSMRKIAAKRSGLDASPAL